MFRTVALWLVLWWVPWGVAQTPEVTIHVVKQGDTLFGICRQYGTQPAEVRAANPGVNLEVIRIGQKIRIPTPTARAVPGPSPSGPPSQGSAVPEAPPPRQATHRVVAGDTLHRIAGRFGVTVAQLREWNGLSGDTIRIGQELRLRPPEGRAPVPPTPTPPPVVEVQPPAPPLPAPRDLPGPPPKPTKPPQHVFVSKVQRQIDAPRVRSGRWKYIVVHHSGTRSGSGRVFEYYHRNVRRMENGMAYHFVIGNGNGSGDGEIEVGDRWRKQLQGGHLASDDLNDVAIGICLVGDFNTQRPTRKQIAALTELIEYLSQKTGPRPRFRAHREINPKPTDCPGKLFPTSAMHRLFDQKK